MTTLRQDMDSDLTEVFLDQDEHAEPATFYPRGDATGFACTVLRSAAPPAMSGEPAFGGSASPRFRASRAALRAGILARTTTTRDAQHGDKLTLTRTSQIATVQTIELTPGDDCLLNCSVATLDAITVGRKATP